MDMRMVGEVSGPRVGALWPAPQGAHYVTSNFVLDEAYILLLHRAGHHVAVELGEEIRASRLVTVVHITADWEEEG
jgi:hypothetical protein